MINYKVIANHNELSTLILHNVSEVGNKAANLYALGKLAEKLNAMPSVFRVAVPDFTVATNATFYDLLQKTEHTEKFITAWRVFQDSFTYQESATEPKARRFITKKLSDTSIAALNNIQTTIRESFSHKLAQAPFSEVQKWLAAQNPPFVIVRSTGSEDSDESSNAGGNLSIPFVTPRIDCVLESMCDVLCSYFSEESIKQRLLAHDVSILDRDTRPLMSVIIQKMIGCNEITSKTPRKDVPRSGVAFTTLKISPGISYFDMVWGNNELTVNGLGKAGSFYSGISGIAHPIQVRQPKLYAPITTGSKTRLATTPTPETIKEGFIVSEREASELSKIATAIGEYYGTTKVPKAMEVEFTIVGNTIYLLQARPKIEKSAPSYICPETIDANPSLFLKPVVLAQNQVAVIESQEQLLLARTIEQALQVCTDSSERDIRLIVIRVSTNATSHPAVMLSAANEGAGIPVMIAETDEAYKGVEDFHRTINTKTTLFGDVQNNVLVKLNTTTDPLDIIEGFCCYPAAAELSCYPSDALLHLMSADAVDEKFLPIYIQGLNSRYIRLIQSLTETISTEEAIDKIKTYNPELSLKDLFKLFRFGSTKESKLALAKLVYSLFNVFSSALHHIIENGESFRLAAMKGFMPLLERLLLQAEREVLPALSLPALDIHRLYAVEFLSLLVSNNDRFVVEARSFKNLLGIVRQEAIISEEFGLRRDAPESQTTSIKMQLLKLLPLAANEATRAALTTIISEASQHPDLQAKFAKIIYSIQRYSLAPFWINIIFRNCIFDIVKSIPGLETIVHTDQAILESVLASHPLEVIDGLSKSLEDDDSYTAFFSHNWRLSAKYFSTGSLEPVKKLLADTSVREKVITYLLTNNPSIFYFTLFELVIREHEILKRTIESLSTTTSCEGLSELQSVHDRVSAQESSITAFSNPKNFHIAFTSLKIYLDSSRFISELETHNKTYTFALLSYISRTVELVDSSIKTMLASNMNLADKAISFTKMLFLYKQIFIAVSAQIGQEETRRLFPCTHPPESFLAKLDTTISEVTTLASSAARPDDLKKQFQPSFGFNAYTLTRGSYYSLECHSVRTLEDFFTAIHQFLLRFINVLSLLSGKKSA